jgi:cell division protease FtsH
MSLEQILRLAIMMGGRVAEELVFGRESLGASDIEQATRRRMMGARGPVEELGTVSYGEPDGVFLGMSVSRTRTRKRPFRRLTARSGVWWERLRRATKIHDEKRAILKPLAKACWNTKPCPAMGVELYQGKPNRESVLGPPRRVPRQCRRPASRASIRTPAWAATAGVKGGV